MNNLFEFTDEALLGLVGVLAIIIWKDINKKLEKSGNHDYIDGAIEKVDKVLEDRRQDIKTLHGRVDEVGGKVSKIEGKLGL